MKLSPDNLPNDIDLLKQLLLEARAAKNDVIEQKGAEIAELKQSVQKLLEQFRLAQQKRFGASSESHDYQGELFNEAEVTVDAPIELTTGDVVPSKKRAKRKPLPKDLPREIIIHDISEADKQCGCGHQLTVMGQDSSEKLKFIPAQISVIDHV